jgi:murein DD-endopeptidase MepM/ murein hydrolase activator NlpD
MAIKLSYPVTARILQRFGENPQIYRQWGYAGHNGIDYDTPVGTPVLAAADGTVEKTGFEASGYGNFVKLVHYDGGTKYATYYAHLQSTAVTNGQPVKAGAVLGLSGTTGASTAPHLHFGIRIDGQNPAFQGYLDPQPYLSGTAPATPSVPSAPAAPSIAKPISTQPTASTATALPGAVDLPGLNFEVIFDGVNVRSGPGVEYAILEQLKLGAKVRGTRLFAAAAWIEFKPGNWCALTFNSATLAKITARSGATVQVSSTAGAIRVPGLNVETLDYLRVRSGPAPTNAEVAPMLNPGSKFIGGQIVAARAWIEIGKDRWVALIFDGTPFLKFL